MKSQTSFINDSIRKLRMSKFSTLACILLIIPFLSGSSNKQLFDKSSATCVAQLVINPDSHWVQVNAESEFFASHAIDSLKLVLQGDLNVVRLAGTKVAGFRRITDQRGQNDTLVVRFHQVIRAGEHLHLQLAASGHVLEQHLRVAVNSFSPQWSEWTDQTNIVPQVLISNNAVRFTYRFHVTLPPSYVLQASGQVTPMQRGQWAITNSARGLFGLYFASALQQRRSQIEGVTMDVVQVPSSDSTWRQALITTAAAAKFYNGLFGKQHQLTHITLILPPNSGRDGLNGWDYAIPGSAIRLQMTGNITDDFYGIGHELAHQWWYSAPYINSNYQSFLNEGFAEYSCLLFYRSKFGQPAFLQLIKRYQDIAAGLGSIQQMPANLTQKQRTRYTYIKAAFTLYQLEQKIGEHAMQGLLQAAVQRQPQSYIEWLKLIEQKQGAAARSFYESIF